MRSRTILWVVIALCALSACSRNTDAPNAGASPSTELIRGNGPEPDSLDPQKARSVEAHMILRDL